MNTEGKSPPIRTRGTRMTHPGREEQMSLGPNNQPRHATGPVPGVVIAAASSGSGKTTIATGLIAALTRTHRVAPFKVGPDYIDPSYHGLAAGRSGRNLDAVLCPPTLIPGLYHHGSAGCDISVVEGVMGLFDGLIPPQGASNYHGDALAAGSTAMIAAQLKMPVILVLDARGMSQSIGAIAKGFATAHPDVRVAGVIVNKVGTPRHAAVCRDAIEAQGIPVVGTIPRIDGVEVPSRHLGLVTATEHGEAARQAVAAMADIVAAHVDLEQIVALAACGDSSAAWSPSEKIQPQGSARIAIAGGPSFTFTYAEHRELLVAAGAEVIDFDPLHDDLPGCDGLIIPGGFPEEYAEALAAREGLAADVRRLAAAGMPIHGECAGLLWLVQTLDGHPMVGALPGHAAMTKRLTLGYRDAVALHDSVLYRAGERIKGHEFHHTSFTPAEPIPADTQEQPVVPAWAWRGWEGTVREEGLVTANIHASYLHVHPAAYPHAVERFVAAAVKFGGRQRT